MTYARARLWLGITGVGAFVTFAVVMLAFDAPLTVPALLVFYALFHTPLDFLGGYHLPLRFSRWAGGAFWPRYLRGVLLHTGLLFAFGLVILRVGVWQGLGAVLALQLLLMLTLIAWQDHVARWISGSRPQDSGFTGGIAGLPGRERVALPATATSFVAQRRRACITTGSRTRGLLVAVAWNLGGFALSAQIPGAGVTTSEQLVRTALGFVLWNFLGLLVLPTISRQGVFEVDEAMSRLGVTKADFALAIQALDLLQDDEPQRSSGVETIFHPIPSVASRIARFGQAVDMPGAWQAARYALFLSWPCLGLLSRAVHCNVGRPDLWVFLPSD